MKRIGIQANTGKPDAINVALSAYEALLSLGATPLLEKGTAKLLNKPNGAYESSEALVVIGGDGTILQSLETAVAFDIPIIGINLGKIGFLSEVEPTELVSAMAKLIADDIVIESRALLQACVKEKQWLALNDVLLYKGAYSHMIDIKVNVASQLVGKFGCDGILISTPTGSTAYSLSAGGSVVAPNVSGTLITPICPHTLSARPMVISKEDVIKIGISGMNEKAHISCDGKPSYNDFVEDDVLTVTTSDKFARFIHLSDYNFFELVRKKLY